MAFFPKLLLLSFSLVLPSTRALVIPDHAQAQFLHFSHNLRNTASVRAIRSYSPPQKDSASTTKTVLPDDSILQVSRLFNKLSTFALRQGLNGDPCSSMSDCQGKRLCAELSSTNSFALCKPEAHNCFCFQPSACYSSSDCDDGEVCFDFPDSAVHVCLSKLTAENVKGSVVDDDNPGNSVTEPDEGGSGSNGSGAVENGSDHNGSAPSGNSSAVNAQGLNGDACSSPVDCQGDRQCYLTLNSTIPEPCTPESSVCFCYKADSSCSTISDCDDGEVCFEFQDRRMKICLSEPYAAKLNASLSGNDSGSSGLESGESEATHSTADECSSSDECESGEECIDTDGSFKCIPVQTEVEDGSSSAAVASDSSTVCIAAHHLSDMRREEMMYPTHILARVLCDKYDNCGTPGHIVKYKGRAMMMSSYCDIELCSEVTREVNSPKYVRHKLVTSNCDDLVFTTLAARYNSRVEEAILSLAVRMGL